MRKKAMIFVTSFRLYFRFMKNVVSVVNLTVTQNAFFFHTVPQKNRTFM